MRYWQDKPILGFFIFSIVSLTVIIGVAFFLSYLTSIPIKENVLEHAAKEASDTTLQVVRYLTPEDMTKPMTGQRLQDFDKFVRNYIETSYTTRIKIWNKESQIIYADDSSIIGQTFLVNHDLQEAFKGSIKKEILKPEKVDNITEKEFDTLIEIYIPLRFPGSREIHGVLEIYELYAPYEDFIHQQQRIVFGANLIGLLALYALLTAMAYYTFVRINRQRLTLAQKEEQIKKASEFSTRALSEQTKLQEGVEHQKERLAHLSLAMNLAQRAPGAIEMGRELLKVIQQEVSSEYASLTLLKPDGTLGERLDIFQGMQPFKVSSRIGGLTESTLKTGKTQYIPDTWEDTRSNPALVASGIRSYICLAMKLDRQMIGIIFFHSTKPHAFQEDRLFLESFANICAIPLQRARFLSQVEQAKEELEVTFDAIPNGVVLIDENKKVLRANEAFARLVGIPVHRLIGVTICKLIHGKDERLHRCPIEESISGKLGDVVSFRESHLANALIYVRTYKIQSSTDKTNRYVQFYSVAG